LGMLARRFQRGLGLSEDEACRRIDVARLARRFPALFPRLASGEILLTVAAVLKPYLTEDNRGDVVAYVSGKTVQQAREALAVLFPQPDVAASVRKLPAARVFPLATAAEPKLTAAPAPPFKLSAPTRIPAPAIQPLSEARYRVQLTASAALKEKLDRATDLMRHRNPSGDLAVVVERGLDLLLEQLMKKRFGSTKNPRAAGDANNQRVTNATRRAALKRDGLQCGWVDPHGRRCESRAWLEFDHRRPRAKGGGSESENIRLLCRAHNRLAAEHEYGRRTIEVAIATRQAATEP
jgi:5-methylcytosine-specific restriction endonuclease McrA